MKNLLQWPILIFMVLITGCTTTGLVTRSYKAKGVDLKEYKTVAWVKPGDEEYQVEFDKKKYNDLILELSTAELKKKGFVFDNEQPDAVFLFDTRIEDRVSYSQTPQVSMGFGFGGPGYYGGFSAPVAGGNLVEKQYKQGMLFIEMYDTKTEKLLWRGWAEEELSYKNDIEADIRKAIKDIFIRLPVKHK